MKKEDGQSWKKDGIVYIDSKIYVPNNWKLWEKILQENQDPANIGHPGQYQMIELIKKNY